MNIGRIKNKFISEETIEEVKAYLNNGDKYYSLLIEEDMHPIWFVKNVEVNRYVIIALYT